MNRKETIAEIKSNLQKRSGKTWSVTGGRGTAWGWLTISVPPKRLGCARFCELDATTDYTCTVCGSRGLLSCPKHVCDDKCFTLYIQPEDREELAKLLNLERVFAQGVNVPSGSYYWEEYVSRAKGETPARYGEQYWD